MTAAIILLVAVSLAMTMSFVVTARQRKQDHKVMEIQDQIEDYLIMISTTHDMADMPWIMALKSAYLSAAVDLGMDTGPILARIDSAINDQFKIITDEMVRSGRR